MLTKLGLALRKFRLDRGLRLLDMAHALGCSAAYLSAVETGRKKTPADFVDKLGNSYSLSDLQLEEFRRAEDFSRKEIRLNEISSANRALVSAFARKVDELPVEVINQLKQQIFKSQTGEIPLERKRRGILVPAAGTDALWNFAEQIRTTFVNASDVEFPIMDVLEFRLEPFFEGFHIEVQTSEELGGDEGRVVAGSNCIILREDVYSGAWNGEGRDRFTACHEFGHFLMHRNVALARASEKTHKIYCDSEWQADTFAGALMMSRQHYPQFTDQFEAADACGMTHGAARVQLEKYRKKWSI